MLCQGKPSLQKRFPMPHDRSVWVAAGLQHTSGRQKEGEKGPEATRQRRDELRLLDTATVGMLPLPRQTIRELLVCRNTQSRIQVPTCATARLSAVPAKPVPVRPASHPGTEQPWEECARPAPCTTPVIPGTTGLARSSPGHHPLRRSHEATGDSMCGADAAGEAQ